MDDPNAQREPFELLADDFTARCRRGERPSIDEYAREHPALAGDIRELFPTIAAIENMKSAATRSSSGGPVSVELQLERLGDFRIIRELGRGGMGIVYEAEQESLGRRVALKVLPRQLLLDPGQLERFEREARTAANLHHTNIVPIFGVGTHDGYHFFAMQYIRGVGLDVVTRELRRRFSSARADADSTPSRSPSSGADAAFDALSIARALARDASWDRPHPGTESRVSTESSAPTKRRAGGSAGPSGDECGGSAPRESESGTDAPPALSVGPEHWRGIARIALQVADACEYAHRQGTLHRDIKPSNLLIDADGIVWVADFGLAKALDQDGVTQTGGVVGTLRYMAPEQFKGKSDVRSDVYSLGMTLYELATLRSAFAATDRTTLIDAIMHGRPKAPRQSCPGIPRDLETIILKAIAREPDARYATAAALAGDLRCFLEDRPIQARRATVSERLWRWARRNPALAALSGTAATLLVAVAAVATIAYVYTSRANVQVRNALDGEQEERQKAEATSALAIEALDTIFDQFAPIRTTAVSSLTVDGAGDTKIDVPIELVLSQESATLLEHMLEFYRRLAAQDDANPALRLKIAEANRRVGNIHSRLGHLDDAEAAYTQAIRLFEQLEADRGPTPTTRVELARIHSQLGTALIAQERIEDGREYFRQARDILEALPSTPSPSPAVRFELARTYYLLAKAPRPPIPTPPGREPGMGPPPDGVPPAGERGPPGRGHGRPGGPPPRHELPDEGGDSWGRAVDILTDLSAAHPGVPDYRHLLGICYRDMPPPMPWFIDDHPSPPDAMARAIEILRQLVRDFPDVPEYRYDLSETYAMAIDHTPGIGPEALALESQRLRAALDISERLVAEHPNIPAYVASQVHIRLRFGRVLHRLNRLRDAEEQLREALAIQTGLARRFPDMPSHQVSVAAIEGAFAGFLRRDGRLDEARSHLDAALAAMDQLPDDWQRPPYVRDVLAATYLDLAHVLRRLGDETAAADAARQAERYRTER